MSKSPIIISNEDEEDAESDKDRENTAKITEFYTADVGS